MTQIAYLNNEAGINCAAARSVFASNQKRETRTGHFLKGVCMRAVANRIIREILYNTR